MNTLRTVIERLEILFTAFNEKFFESQLEKPVITINPDTTRGAYGWCTNWRAWDNGNNDGFYEINLCAEHLNCPFPELYGTLLHEMVHLLNLQDEVQDTSRNSLYHNKRFKETAEAHGLTVEKDAKYGYCRTTLTNETLQWLKEQFSEDRGFTLHRKRKEKGESKKSSSRKYVCPVCGSIVRATKPVNIKCADCDVWFEESEV